MTEHTEASGIGMLPVTAGWRRGWASNWSQGSPVKDTETQVKFSLGAKEAIIELAEQQRIEERGYHIVQLDQSPAHSPVCSAASLHLGLLRLRRDWAPG